MRIAIASDHAGYGLKEHIKAYLEEKGYEMEDCGCYSEASVDYPDLAKACALKVAGGEAERGIVICGTGVGISIAANKVKGIRCALCTDPVMSRLTREHNDANMLAMGARIIGTELARAITDAFLTTGFAGGRHAARVDKLMAIESEAQV